MMTHTTVMNREVKYTPTPAEAAFIQRVAKAANDPKATVDDMIALVYGAENPILEPGPTGRPWVTEKVFTNPVYRVLTDYIARKEVTTGKVNLEEVQAAYTVSVPTAAEQLGMSVQAVRAAIDSWRLPALYRKGQWWLRPESVVDYRASGRAKAANPSKVIARMGGSSAGGGTSLSVRFLDGSEFTEVKKRGETSLGFFPPGWTRALVKTTSPRGTRAFEIEPAESDESIGFDGEGESGKGSLYVNGQFRIVKKHNATAAANAAWKATAPK